MSVSVCPASVSSVEFPFPVSVNSAEPRVSGLCMGNPPQTPAAPSLPLSVPGPGTAPEVSGLRVSGNITCGTDGACKRTRRAPLVGRVLPGRALPIAG